MRIPCGKENITAISAVFIDRVYEDEKGKIFLEFNNGTDGSTITYVGSYSLKEILYHIHPSLVEKQAIGFDPFSMVWCLPCETLNFK